MFALHYGKSRKPLIWVVPDANPGMSSAAIMHAILNAAHLA